MVLTLGEQEITSKKNTETSTIGPPGAPIWNQDFDMLVVSRKEQQLAVLVKDALGLTFTVGYGEVRPAHVCKHTCVKR